MTRLERFRGGLCGIVEGEAGGRRVPHQRGERGGGAAVGADMVFEADLMDLPAAAAALPLERTTRLHRVVRSSCLI